MLQNLVKYGVVAVEVVEQEPGGEIALVSISLRD
jgi:hypothetical protein